MRARMIVCHLMGSMAVFGASAGDLEPPGAPASTPGTLEGRIAITEVPTVISEPGSYVLTDDLSLSALDTHAITVSAENVTIDLNGFSLTGPGKDAGASGDGIRAEGQTNISVLGGTVRDFRGAGVRLLSTPNCEVTRMRVYSNGDDGIFMSSNGNVTDCILRGNGGVGIRTGLTNVIRGNSARNNVGGGIFVFTGSCVTGNACEDNSQFGINATYSLVSGNACLGNGGNNIVSTGSTVIDNFAP